MTREQLKSIAAQFFRINSDVKYIFVTEDKHCWYEELHAKKHCAGAKEYYKFTPEDFKEKVEEKAAPKKANLKKEDKK